MEAKLLAISIPVFFLLIGIELLVSRLQRARRYEFQDSITNLSCGVGQQMLQPFFQIGGLVAYAFVYEKLRVTSIPTSSALGWLGLLLGVDLAYYVFHRASHRINFLWAEHVVHHQSEEYNLSVALRQSWFDKLVEPYFYLPLALLGFAPEAFLFMTTINTLYQFWIHTRAVKRLGPLEWFLNTPSHHRVHHGTNPKYIDKNYGGIFIVWDRLFGTFQREEEEPVYGIVKPLASWNPLWANVHYWVEMARMAAGARRLRDKVWTWLAPPEWRPDSGKVTIPEVSRETQRRYAAAPRAGVNVYAGLQFLIVGGVVAAIDGAQEHLTMRVLALIALVVIANLVTWSGLFESKRWAVPLELARLAVVPFVAALATEGTPLRNVVVGAAAATSLAFGVWALRYRASESAVGEAVR